MGVVRVIHFADLHLGVESGGRTNPASGLNQRIHDVCDRLDEVCAVAECEQVHLVVFAGDAFKHQHPTPTLQRLFAERIRRLSRTGTRVFLLVGNHDLPKMAALAHPFSIYAALEVEGVVVGDRAQVYTLPLPPGAPAAGVQVAALPHFSRQQVLARISETDGDPDELMAASVEATVRKLGAAVDPSLPALFAGHCHVNQAELGTGQSLFGVNDVEVSLSTLTSGQPFPYYALGHVHRRQVLCDQPFVAYSGSLERVDFGEGDRITVSSEGRVERRGGEEKGFYRFDLREREGRWGLAAEPDFRPVRARPFLTVRAGVLSSDDPAASLLARLDAVRGAGISLQDAFVKVSCSLEASDRGRLGQAVVREHLAEAYEVSLAVESLEETVRVRDPRFAVRMGEREALDRYLETRDDWAPEREELLALGRGLIEEVLR